VCVCVRTRGQDGGKTKCARIRSHTRHTEPAKTRTSREKETKPARPTVVPAPPKVSSVQSESRASEPFQSITYLWKFVFGGGGGGGGIAQSRKEKRLEPHF